MNDKVIISYDDCKLIGSYRIKVKNSRSYELLEEYLNVDSNDLERTLELLKKKYSSYDLCFFKY